MKLLAEGYRPSIVEVLVKDMVLVEQERHQVDTRKSSVVSKEIKSHTDPILHSIYGWGVSRIRGPMRGGIRLSPRMGIIRMRIGGRYRLL